MKEDIVSYITAKLAKKGGFMWSTSEWFYEETLVGFRLGNGIQSMYSPWDNSRVWNKDNYSMAAPTQALLQKWLREVHNIHITIFSSSQESWMFRVTKPHQQLKDGVYGEDFTSYEEALEAGLQEALKLL